MLRGRRVAVQHQQHGAGRDRTRKEDGDEPEGTDHGGDEQLLSQAGLKGNITAARHGREPAGRPAERGPRRAFCARWGGGRGPHADSFGRWITDDVEVNRTADHPGRGANAEYAGRVDDNSRTAPDRRAHSVARRGWRRGPPAAPDLPRRRRSDDRRDDGARSQRPSGPGSAAVRLHRDRRRSAAEGVVRAILRERRGQWRDYGDLDRAAGRRRPACDESRRRGRAHGRVRGGSRLD